MIEWTIKGTKSRGVMRIGHQNGEWFISPLPFNPLICLCEGVRCTATKKRKDMPLWSWTDIKESCSDAMTPTVVGGIEKLIATCEKDLAANPDPHTRTSFKIPAEK